MERETVEKRKGKVRRMERKKEKGLKGMIEITRIFKCV